MGANKKLAKFVVGTAVVATLGGGAAGAGIQHIKNKKADKVRQAEQVEKNKKVLSVFDENTRQLIPTEAELQQDANRVMMDIFAEQDSVIRADNAKVFSDVMKKLSKEDLNKLRVEDNHKLSNDDLERVVRHCYHRTDKNGKLTLYIDGADLGMGLDWEGQGIQITQADGKTNVLQKIVDMHKKLNQDTQKRHISYEEGTIYWRGNVDYYEDRNVYDLSDFTSSEGDTNAKIFWDLVKAVPKTHVEDRRVYEGSPDEILIEEVNKFIFGQNQYLDFDNPYVKNHMKEITRIVNDAKNLKEVKKNRDRIVQIQENQR